MRKREITKGQLIEIRWVDSSAPKEDTWVDPATLDTRVDGMKTVGWVQHITKEIVTVAASVDTTNGWVGGVMTIPLRSIDRGGVRELT